MVLCSFMVVVDEEASQQFSNWIACMAVGLNSLRERIIAIADACAREHKSEGSN